MIKALLGLLRFKKFPQKYTIKLLIYIYKMYFKVIKINKILTIILKVSTEVPYYKYETGRCVNSSGGKDYPLDPMIRLYFTVT